MKKGKIIAACAGVLLVAAAAGCLLVLHRNGVFEVATPAASSKGGYLFCYFTGNEPEQERIHFAVSKDGYHFTPLNGNHPVIAQTKAPVLCGTLICFKGKMELTTFLQPI